MGPKAPINCANNTNPIAHSCVAIYTPSSYVITPSGLLPNDIRTIPITIDTIPSILRKLMLSPNNNHEDTATQI